MSRKKWLGSVCRLHGDGRAGAVPRKQKSSAVEQACDMLETGIRAMRRLACVDWIYKCLRRLSFDACLLKRVF